MAATVVVCYILLFTFVAVSEGTECRHDALVELSANSKAKYIYSPNYPEPYPAFALCRWRIRIESQSRTKIIQIRTVDMEVPTEQENCSNVYVKAFDGQYNTAPLIKEWCDDSTIFSTGPYMIVEFHSGHLSSKGFALSFHEVNIFSHKCLSGDVQKIDVTQTPLVVTFPDDDAFKDGNEGCEWLFTSSKSVSKIIVELDEWTIDSTPDFCNNSSIAFYDGNSSDSLEILNYCHHDRPFHRLVTSSRSLFIRFHGSWQKHTTKLPVITLNIHSVKIKNPSIDCHSNLQTSVVGSIPSFIVFPAGELDTEDSMCPVQLWSKDRDSTVKVDIVGSSEDETISCQDYLVAYNNDDEEDAIPVHCIGDQPSYLNPRRIKLYNTTRPTERLVLRAYTVDSPCNGQALENWAENDIKKSLDLVNGKSSYINNGYCKYLLKAEKGDERIKLFVNGSFYDWNFGDFGCNKDFIALYDGNNEDSPMITKWCGGAAPDGFHSTGQHMLVIFRSDHQGRQRNQNYNLEYIAYKEMCSRFAIPLNATSSPQNLTSPGYPDYYPPESICNWIIRPSSDNHNIVFRLMTTSLGPHCKSMVSVYENEEEGTEPLIDFIGRACEKETPTLKSSKGAVNIVFRSDKFWNVGGFLAEYWEEPIPEPESEPIDSNSGSNSSDDSDSSSSSNTVLTSWTLYVYFVITILFLQS